MQVESKLNQDEVNVQDVYNLLQEMREESKTQINKLEVELGNSVEMCHARIEDLIKTIDAQSVTIKHYQENLDQLKHENAELSKKCQDFENRLDDLEQYSRINCIELNGIPEEKNEDVQRLIQKVGNSIGVNIDDTDIDACHRLGVAKEDSKRTRGIIVKFTRRSIKEQVLQKRRVKRNLNTKDIGFLDRPAEVIYINESLSSGRRKVLNAARLLKKEEHLQYVWVRNGRVLTRAEDGAKVVVVSTMEQVAAMRPSDGGTPVTPMASTDDSQTSLSSHPKH